jgi:hypothetical protein
MATLATADLAVTLAAATKWRQCWREAGTMPPPAINDNDMAGTREDGAVDGSQYTVLSEDGAVKE